VTRKKLSSEERGLIKRYLLWCYKTTKEDLERIDRKFTQLEVDYFVLDCLNKSKTKVQKKSKPQFLRKIGEFEKYIKDKERMAKKEKYLNSKSILNPDYLYLKNRLSSIENAIESFLSKTDLDLIKEIYQTEMERRIVVATGH